MPPVVTLTTDFGLRDPFVGIMKGVLLTRAPKTRVVDITHDIEPQNLTQAAWILSSAWPWFPQGTIHLVVVDPGVGSARRPIAVQHKRHIFIGPDNGVLTPALETRSKIYALDKVKFFLKPVSRTFHGRDIFASVAGWLAKGVSLKDMGTPVKNPVTFDLPEPVFKNSSLCGQVVYIDHFGNLTTNIKSDHINNIFKKNKKLAVWAGRRRIGPLADHYTQPVKGQPGALINSWDALEIFCREGNASKKLKMGLGQSVTIKPVTTGQKS